MKPMQRQFGKLMSKGAGDAAKVSVLLSDYEEADKSLMKVGGGDHLSLTMALDFD
jgi:amphiphysin